MTCAIPLKAAVARVTLTALVVVQAAGLAVPVASAAPTFTITVSDNEQIQFPGQTLVYKVRVTNTSTETATGVTILDTLPSAVTFQQATGGGTHGGTTVTWSNVTIAANAFVEFDVSVSVNANAAEGTVLTNTASVGSLTATDTTTVQFAKADVSLIVTSPTVLEPGTGVVYRAELSNAGPQSASNVVVRKPVPSGLTFQPQFSSASCSLQGSDVVCTANLLPVGGALNFDMGFLVSPTITCGSTVPSTVTVSSTTTDPLLSNNTITYSSPVSCLPQADLAVTMAGPATLTGSLILYDVTVRNNGPDTATDVRLYDVIAQTTLAGFASGASASECSTPNSYQVNCTVGTLTSGQSKVLRIAFQTTSSVSCGATIRNDVNVYSNANQNVDPEPANDDAAITSVVSCPATVYTIATTDNRTVAFAGDVVTYVITVTNPTPFNQDVTGITVIDTLPTGVTPISASLAGTIAGNTVTWSNRAIFAGDTLTLTVQAQVNANVSNGTVLVNSARIVGGNTATDSTTVQAAPSTFTIQKNDGRTVASPGEALTYSITVQNIGNTSSGVTLTDTLPAGVTFISASNGGTFSNGVVTWPLQTVAPGDNFARTVIVTVNANVANGTVLTNTARVGSATGTDTTLIQAATASFSVTKTDGRTSALQNDQLIYTITVQNTGSIASGAVLTDNLPSGVTFLSASNGGTLSNGTTVTWSNQSLAPDASFTRTVTVRVNQNLANGTVLTNVARFGSTVGTDTTTVQPSTVLLSILNSDGKTSATPNETLVYTITVQNNGNTSTGVVLTDVLPVGTTFSTASDNGVQSNGTVTWPAFTLAPGATMTRTLTVLVNANATNGTVVSNVARAGNAVGTDTTTVQTGSATLTIDLSDSQDTVSPCDLFTYTVRLTNVSGVAASNVSVSQTLDGDLEFQSASNSGIASNGTVTWTGLSITAGGSLSLTVSVKTKCSADDGDVLQSTAATGGISDAETTRVRDDDDDDNEELSVSVRDSRDPVRSGECFEYIITVENGDNTSVSVDVTGFLDDDTEFKDADRGGREQSAGRIEWDNVSIAADDEEELHATVCVQSGVHSGQSLEFRARAEDEEDTEFTRVDANASGGGSGDAAITVDKRADRNEAQPGSVVTYTVTLRNPSAIVARDFTLTDTFDAGSLTVEDAGGGAITGNGITWTIATVAPDETRVITYRVRISASMRHGQTVSNTITARGGNLNGEATDTEQVRIIQNLPQTGLGGFLAATRDRTRLRAHAGSDTGAQSGSLSLLFWTTLVTSGIGAGGLLGRRLIG